MKKTKWIATFMALSMTALIAFAGCEQPTSHTSPNSPVKPRGMTLAEATAAIKAIPATFDASRDEPLQIVFAGDMSYTQEESTAFYNAMKAAPDGSVAIDMAQVDMTEIPEVLFTYINSLVSIILPKNANSTGTHILVGCESLKEVVIPSSLTSIGIYAFAQCTSLTKITVETGNKHYTSENGILYNKNKTKLIAWPSVSGNATVPNSVTSIADGAFGYNLSLTNITIHDNVTHIGDYAFYSTALQDITIPNNVTSIGKAAFLVCTSLHSVKIGSSITSIGERAFERCTSLDTINYAGTKNEWNTKITFGSEWKIGIPTTTGVTCTDGTYKFVGSSSSAADSKLGDPI